MCPIHTSTISGVCLWTP